MPIRFDKANKRWRFEFDRYINHGRERTSRLLPKGWTRVLHRGGQKSPHSFQAYLGQASTSRRCLLAHSA